MKQYLDLCRHIMENGELRQDRTGTGTKSCFGYQMRIDLREGFPLLTTKKVFFKGIAEELLWFISGSTNIQPLVLKNVKIWNEWPYEKYTQSSAYQNESLEEFIERIKTEDDFAKQWGELGPVYGHQWRDFFGVDHLENLIHDLKENPFSRRHIISAWNPAQIKDMALPRCSAAFLDTWSSLMCHCHSDCGSDYLFWLFRIVESSCMASLLYSLAADVFECQHSKLISHCLQSCRCRCCLSIFKNCIICIE